MPRRIKTRKQRALEALAVAQRRYDKAARTAANATDAAEAADIEERTAQGRLDYARNNPDLTLGDD